MAVFILTTHCSFGNDTLRYTLYDFRFPVCFLGLLYSCVLVPFSIALSVLTHAKTGSQHRGITVSAAAVVVTTMAVPSTIVLFWLTVLNGTNTRGGDGDGDGSSSSQNSNGNDNNNGKDLL